MTAAPSSSCAAKPPTAPAGPLIPPPIPMVPNMPSGPLALPVGRPGASPMPPIPNSRQTAVPCCSSKRARSTAPNSLRRNRLPPSIAARRLSSQNGESKAIPNGLPTDAKSPSSRLASTTASSWFTTSPPAPSSISPPMSISIPPPCGWPIASTSFSNVAPACPSVNRPC